MEVIGIDFMIEAMINGLKADTIYPIKTAVQFNSNASIDEKSFHIPSLLTKLPSEKRFGKKTSAGLYRYEREKPVNEESMFYIEPSRAAIPIDNADESIMDRLLYSIFHGILFSLFHQMASADDLNIGVKEILQMKNGPMTMMKRLGADKVNYRFKQLAEQFGRRFDVPNQLIGLIK
jgi:3-hydroxyacyl-CoA dehydrogenase